MTNDQTTVSRELLRQVLNTISLPQAGVRTQEAIKTLRTALEQPAVESVAVAYTPRQGQEWSKEFDNWWSANRVSTHNVKSAEGFARRAWKAAIQTVAGATDSTTGFYPVDGGSSPPRQANDEQPTVEPVAEVYQKMTGGNSFPGTGVRMLVDAPLLSAGTKLYAAPQAQQPAPVQDPRNHVGNSSFESWYADYNPSGKGDKQRARDAYAAGMGDPVYLPAQQPQLLTDEEIKDAIRHLYQDETALQMSMDITLHEFRAIEQAVLKRMWWSE